MVMEGVEPSTVALLAQRSNQLSYTTFLAPPNSPLTNIPACVNIIQFSTKVDLSRKYLGL